MFVSRDQENLVHAQQTASAAKSLHNLASNYAGTVPKTPLPRKGKGFSDENSVAVGGGKTLLTKKGFGAEGTSTDGFVTPAAPRLRAPLSQKTTNAKARTPAPPLGGNTVRPTQRRSAKRSTPRRLMKPSGLRESMAPRSTPIPTPKEEHLDIPIEDELPDIEYAPPKPKALPDPPEPVPYDTNFPQFRGRNFARGWDEMYSSSKEKAELDELEMEDKYEDFDREMERCMLEDIQTLLLEEDVESYHSNNNNKKSSRDTLIDKPVEILDPHNYMDIYGKPDEGSKMWRRCKREGLL